MSHGSLIHSLWFIKGSIFGFHKGFYALPDSCHFRCFKMLLSFLFFWSNCKGAGYLFIY
ncbi:hypothetical protein ACE6H2_025495 [Prunus campanulata]